MESETPVRRRESGTGANARGLPSFPGLSGITPLDSGAMGSVFRAWQDDLGRPVAVKTLRPELRADADLERRFVREAHILASLDHPGIVPVHAAGRTELGPYYVMRLVEGVPVDRALAGRAPLEVARVFRDLARALERVHREGVLHRDLKPANVLVETDGRPVLVDFGVSVRLRGGEPARPEEGLVGTPDYLAPELLSGAEASVRSDVYALGATLYTTLTGRVPFPAEDLDGTLRAILEDDPPLPCSLRPDLPSALQAICLKAMEREPQDRYASAEALARDLERFLQGDVVEAHPVRSRSLLRRKLQLHLEDHADWARQGLLDEPQRLRLRAAYEQLDEEQRAPLRGVLGSVPNLLLLVGILLSVFGPTWLTLATWDAQGRTFRLALLAAPLALLGGLGSWRWRLGDRRRALACLLGAALLTAPLAFALADLLPALRVVLDAGGMPHSVVPGAMWLPGEDAPDWARAGAPLLQGKLLLAFAASATVAALLFRGTRAAAFLWIACLAAAGASVCAAGLLGWAHLPLAARWLLAGAGAGLVLRIGRAFDRSFQGDRARPFYGLGFLALVLVALTYGDRNLPLALFGVARLPLGAPWCHVLHGLGFLALGLLLHARGTPLQRQVCGLPLFVGLLLTLVGSAGLAALRLAGYEILLVAACVGLLVLGLLLQRNALVLPAALALPLAIGSVTQHHIQALWAWSASVGIGGATLVLLSFRLAPRAHGGAGATARQAKARRG